MVPNLETCLCARGAQCCGCGGGTTDGVPTPAPTSTVAPTPQQKFEVVSGDCIADGYCFQSPEYPSSYDDNQRCTIRAKTNGELRIEYFDVEFESSCGWDALVIDGISYCGTTGPDGLILSPDSSLEFSSDYAATAGGFKICMEDVGPSPMPHADVHAVCVDEEEVDEQQEALADVPLGCATP